MNKVLSKLAIARKIIRNKNTSKDGKNTFSKYDYYTPEQISNWIMNACDEAGIITCFSLECDEYGLYGRYTVCDLDSEERVDFNMRTKKPSMTAANEAQEMGSCVTYVERYLGMSTFQIKDNSLDPDSDQSAGKKTSKNTKAKNTKDEKPWFNEPDFTKFKGKVTKNEGKDYVSTIRDHFKLSKEMEAKVTTYLTSING